MTSITSSSSYSASASNSASASKGFSGLVSGINTEEMVTKLLSGTQAKIDKQKANKQILEWKQSMYRDVITSFNNFKQSYFSYTSQTNLLSSAFFNTMSSNVNSDKIKVTAASGAQAGQLKISNIKLATTHTEKSAVKASGKLEAVFDLDRLSALGEGAKLEITLDGVTKKIELNTNAASAEEFAQSLQTAVNKAFGNGIEIKAAADKISFEVSESRQVILKGEEDVLKALDITNGASNKISLNSKLKDINFGQALQGGSFVFEINGVRIEASADDSLNSLISRINSSDAGVKVSYSSLEDRFILTSTVTGKLIAEGSDDFKFSLKNVEGNLLTSLFGAAPAQDVGSKLLKVTDEDGKTTPATAATKLTELGWQGKISVNGIEINVSESEEDTVEDLVNRINLVLDGSGAAAVIEEKEGFGIKIKICGVEIPMEMAGLDEEGTKTMEALFGKGKQTFFADPDFVPAETITTVEGQNASLVINGILVERNSNSFNVDGLQIDLLAESAAGEEITVDTVRNTDKIMEGIKKFVEDYNNLLDKLNGLINAEPSYKDYPPLTAEQKKEMSEREIELWEEKAKEGLLRRDEHITKALRDMRTALYTKPEGALYSLYDLGITTGSWSDRGKLTIEEPPTKLLEALANDPQSVEKLFNDATEGIAVKLSNIIDATAKVSSGSPGSLVLLAGAKSLMDKNNTLARQMSEIDKLLERLNATYEKEKERYWKQFNSMEQLISQMNQQSAWLAQQFSY